MSLICLFFGCMLSRRESATCSALSPDREGIMGAKTSANGFSSRGPTMQDCQRLWDTLVTEYVTDLGMRVLWQAAKMPNYRACIQVWSPGLDPATGGPKDHIWAIKEINQGYEAITYVQLYDLLIQAYRVIQGHLGGQVELPLH